MTSLSHDPNVPDFRRDAAGWRVARLLTLTMLGLALLGAVAVVLGHRPVVFGFRLDVPGAVMSVLVGFLGWVIVRYSQTYLDGQAGQARHAAWMMGALVSVMGVVLADHLVLLALAWMASSLCVHRLLTFYADRAPARLAAHKKFIVARAADVCMALAVMLLATSTGTLRLSTLLAQADASGALSMSVPLSAQLGLVLVAIAALLKCAQLPVHGWLIQVMEAPTPVSALLHAGVVNLGGFVLLRFAPLIDQVPAAQALLVVVGSTTAVLAALVMSTRISIKVMLAWSTSAQMGFMLMQCGLGLWGLALLHLVAHSLYKAHAFLSAGTAVQQHVQSTQAAPHQPVTATALVAGLAAGLLMALAAGAVWSWLVRAQGFDAVVPSGPAVWVLSAIVGIALMPLLHQRLPAQRGFRQALPACLAFGVALTYFGLHAASGLAGMPSSAPPLLLVIWVALVFAALFMVQAVVMLHPHGALSRVLYPWFYGGLFLDERFSRVALRWWPPARPASANNVADS